MNTHAHQSESPARKRKIHHHTGVRVLAVLVVVALIGVAGWWARGVHESPDRMSQVKGRVQELLDKGKLGIDDGIKRFEGALTHENLEDAEHALGDLRNIAAKDGRLAALQTRLAAAQIQKALSEKNLDRAREALAKAEKSGVVAIDQIKRWKEQIDAARTSASSSDSSRK